MGIGSFAFFLLLSLQELDGALLFNEAVKVQTPNGKAPVIATFTADLAVEFYETDDNGKAKPPKSARVVEFWKTKGERELYRRVLKSDETVTNLCTNGISCTMWEEPKVKGKPVQVRNLLEPELKQDYQQLQDEMHRTRELLALFFLANLKGPGVTFVIGEELKMPLERKGAEPLRTIPVILLTRKKAGEPDMRLSIGKEDHRLYGVEKRPKDPKQPPEQFRFEAHAFWNWNDDGMVRQCLIPMVVHYYYNGRETLRAAVDKPTDIKFNEPLSDKLFEMN